MFVDASALTALITSEAGWGELAARLRRTRERTTSPLAVWEAGVAVARVLQIPVSEANRSVHGYLGVAEILLVPVPPEAGALALEAFDRYGKGRHPARLNMGDCFAYACARHLKQPLLYKGTDFSQTDIEAG